MAPRVISQHDRPHAAVRRDHRASAGPDADAPLRHAPGRGSRGAAPGQPVGAVRDGASVPVDGGFSAQGSPLVPVSASPTCVVRSSPRSSAWPLSTASVITSELTEEAVLTAAVDEPGSRTSVPATSSSACACGWRRSTATPSTRSRTPDPLPGLRPLRRQPPADPSPARAPSRIADVAIVAPSSWWACPIRDHPSGQPHRRRRPPAFASAVGELRTGSRPRRRRCR